LAAKSPLVGQEVESQPPRYVEALEILLSPKKYLPFVVLCNSKIREFLEEKYFLNGFMEVVNEIGEDKVHKQVQYDSSEWYELFNLEFADDEKA
jgi:hypothetical protein